MKIALSLFDGMSCGQLALQRAGVSVDYYLASEVDQYAMTVTKKNFPETEHIGDVRGIDGTTLVSPFILMGGSPCQSFSFAGKRNGMSTEQGEEVTTLERYLELKSEGFQFSGQSYLFWEYVRILRETKPKYFLLENVKMSKKWEDVISEALGVRPVVINSALVSAQNRKRLYWTSIEVTQPKQTEWVISDFIEGDGFATSCGIDRVFKKKDIFNTLTATYWKGIRGSGRPTVSVREGFLDDDREAHRMLTPTECERLQTVPIGYTEGVSNTQRYKMLGNGWTVDVIAHILSHIPEEEK